MAVNVDRRPTDATVEELIELLDRTTDPSVIEMVANRLAATRDHRAIRPLLMHLGDRLVQDDAEVEDAMCHALMALGVMCSTGDLSFSLRPRRAFTDDVAETIRE